MNRENRKVDQYWNEKCWILLHFCQTMGFLWTMSLSWPWPVLYVIDLWHLHSFRAIMIDRDGDWCQLLSQAISSSIILIFHDNTQLSHLVSVLSIVHPGFQLLFQQIPGVCYCLSSVDIHCLFMFVTDVGVDAGVGVCF